MPEVGVRWPGFKYSFLDMLFRLLLPNKNPPTCGVAGKKKIPYPAVARNRGTYDLIFPIETPPGSISLSGCSLERKATGTETLGQMLMKPEYLDRLIAWSREEVESLKAKGATEEDAREPAFNSLLTGKVIEKHGEEIHADPLFVQEIILSHLETASPAQLREMAAAYRGQGRLKQAYDLELAADERERGEFIESDS